MTVVLAAAGALVIVTALVDVIWTTVAAGSGAGPLTGRIAGGLWQLALAGHRRSPSQARLSLAGVATVVSVLVMWVVLVFVGWLLVFTASAGAVRTTDTGVSADLAARIYFVGYTLFTLGNGDYFPGDGTWQLATVLATLTGLVLVTLSITYLVPVASAVAQRRQLAAYITSLGASPSDVLTRSWTGSGFGSLSQHLVSLTALVHGARQHHLTYPILHYFHSQERESAAAPAMTTLSGTLHLLRHAVAADHPDPAAVDALDEAIGTFLATLSKAYIHPSEEAVPPPTLDHLRRTGLPIVDDTAYASATAATLERRRMLAAFLRNDGWPIDEGAPP